MMNSQEHSPEVAEQKYQLPSAESPAIGAIALNGEVEATGVNKKTRFRALRQGAMIAGTSLELMGLNGTFVKNMVDTARTYGPNPDFGHDAAHQAAVEAYNPNAEHAVAVEQLAPAASEV